MVDPTLKEPPIECEVAEEMTLEQRAIQDKREGLRDIQPLKGGIGAQFPLRGFIDSLRSAAFFKLAWSLLALAGLIVGEVALARTIASGSCPPGDGYCTLGQGIDDELRGDAAAFFFFVCLAVWVAGLGVINFVVWLRDQREDQRLKNELHHANVSSSGCDVASHPRRRNRSASGLPSARGRRCFFCGEVLGLVALRSRRRAEDR